MRSISRAASALLLPLVAVACASAGDRLEQGMELEMQGRWDEAVARYVEALEKDENMVEARDRLMEVGDSAVTSHLREADGWASRGDPMEAANHYHRIDNLLARARTVGVRLPIPADYTQRRRGAFDEATEALLERAEAAQNRGQWSAAVSDFQRAQSDYEPVNEQRERALTGESESLLFWSQDELGAGRLRAAYEVAGGVHELGFASREVSLEADRVMEEALSLGQVEVMALPLVVGGPVPARPRPRDPGLMDLEIRTNDLLAQGPWRSPPPFIRLTEDRAVREVVREATVLGGGLRAGAMGLLLRLVDAEYGAWLELLTVEATEFDVDQRTRTVRTRDGQTTSFMIEDGDRRLRAEARVVVVDRQGNPLTDVVVIATGVGQFRRGVFDGDPAALNLDRRDVDLFDRIALEAQEAAIRQALAEDLAFKLGAAVFDPVLARIP